MRGAAGPASTMPSPEPSSVCPMPTDAARRSSAPAAADIWATSSRARVSRRKTRATASIRSRWSSNRPPTRQPRRNAGPRRPCGRPWRRPISPEAASGAWSTCSASWMASWTWSRAIWADRPRRRPTNRSRAAARDMPRQCACGSILRGSPTSRSHDPTQENGQGPDIGDQYRSEIFYTSPEQRAVAYRLISLLRAKGYEVVTEVAPAGRFWPAEAYHQDYYLRKGTRPYCHGYTRRF